MSVGIKYQRAALRFDWLYAVSIRTKVRLI